MEKAGQVQTLWLIFVGKARDFQYGKPIRLLALPTNVILGWKGLAGPNALVYFCGQGQRLPVRKTYQAPGLTYKYYIRLDRHARE
jgi:hypothetical protein